MSDTILIDRYNGWMEITLNRPERLNAFNDAMHATLFAILEEATAPSIRAVLLTGAGRGFCAGQDLDGRDPRKMVGPPDLGQTLDTLYNPLVRQLRSLEKPVICAVNGVAAGAGANIAFGCDIILAADTAKFIQSFAKVGLVPDAGGTHHLAQILGPMRAKAWAMSAEPIDAQTARDWGLVWKVFPADDLMAHARTMAADMANGATMGLAATKSLIHAATDNTLEVQLDLEAETQRICGASQDYREGVTAFLDKRSAQYQGK